MAAVTLLGTQTWTTTAGNKTVTATPAVNDLIVVVAGASGTSEANAATTNVTDDNSSGTYYKVADSFAGSSPRISIWVRTALIGSASSTIFTATQASSSGGGLAVFKVTGMTRTGLAAARRTGREWGALSTTPTINLITPVDTNNAVIGGVVNSTSPAGLTAPASWTERSDAGYSTPTTGIETASRDSGEAASSIAWGSTSASNWRAVVVELDTRALSAIPLSTLGVGG